MQLKKTISFGLVIIAVIYLVSLVMKQPSDKDRFLEQYSLSVFMLSLIPAVAMVIFAAAYHVLTVARLSPKQVSRMRVMKSYAVAQVVRYLPGKIWGILYEVNNLSGEVSSKHVITANLIQALLTNLMAIGLSIIVITFWLYEEAWILLLSPSVVIIVEILHRNPFIEKQAVAVISRLFSHSKTDVMIPSPIAVRATVVLILEWVAFVAVWWLLLGHETMAKDILAVSAYYAVASILSIAALAAPGGIAVREALFVALASTLEIDQITLLGHAAAARIVFTAAELLLVILLYWTSMVIRWRHV